MTFFRIAIWTVLAVLVLFFGQTLFTRMLDTARQMAH